MKEDLGQGGQGGAGLTALPGPCWDLGEAVSGVAWPLLHLFPLPSPTLPSP